MDCYQLVARVHKGQSLSHLLLPLCERLFGIPQLQLAVPALVCVIWNSFIESLNLLHMQFIDGHHKLVRWRFVTHCAIDGYSRLVLFLKCSDNNESDTVYTSFLQAVRQYGLPSRIRCDQGKENVRVAQHMLHHRGIERRSVLVGSSVHNQRIERLWRDSYRSRQVHFSVLTNPNRKWSSRNESGVPETKVEFPKRKSEFPKRK